MLDGLVELHYLIIYSHQEMHLMEMTIECLVIMMEHIIILMYGEA